MFDFIGDVHGEYNLLAKLLEKAGYQKDSDGTFFHKTQKAFFLGDFIDKGPQVLKTYLLVKSMIEKGYAQAIIGNHELNFISVNTEYKGSFLRARTKNNLKQINKSLELLPKLEETVEFLLSLPIFIEGEDFRAVHACWHNPSIDLLKSSLGNKINLDKLKTISHDKCPEYSALNISLKGLEVDLSPHEYKDYLGFVRNKARVNWWENGLLESLPEEYKTLPHNEKYFYTDEKKVFFGHYTKKVPPYIQGPKALCLDFCGSKHLCLYRNVPGDISKENLIFVSK